MRACVRTFTREREREKVQGMPAYMHTHTHTQLWLATFLRLDAHTLQQQQQYTLMTTHAHTQCDSMKVLWQAVNLTLINPSFYGNQSVNQSVQSKSQLRITSTSSKTVGHTLSPSLQEMFEQSLVRQAQKVCSDAKHVLHSEYQLLPSGQHYRIPKCKLNHYKYSFIN